MSNVIMRALISKRRGILLGFEMAAASYQYSRSHGLSVWQSVAGAVRLFRQYSKRGAA